MHLTTFRYYTQPHTTINFLKTKMCPRLHAVAVRVNTRALVRVTNMTTYRYIQCIVTRVIYYGDSASEKTTLGGDQRRICDIFRLHRGLLYASTMSACTVAYLVQHTCSWIHSFAVRFIDTTAQSVSFSKTRVCWPDDSLTAWGDMFCDAQCRN